MPLQEPGFDESMEAITRHCLEAQKDLSKVSRMLKSLESCASFSCEGDKIEQVLEKCQTTCKNAAHVLREQRLLLKDNNIEEQERIKRWVRFDRLSRSLDSHRAMLNALRSKYTVFTRRLDAEREYRKISSSFDIESHPEAENALLLSQQASHSEKEEYQVMMVSEIEIDSHILSERNEGMQRIQRDMSSVNEIFKDMSTLTEEQGLIIGLCIGFCQLTQHR